MMLEVGERDPGKTRYRVKLERKGADPVEVYIFAYSPEQAERFAHIRKPGYSTVAVEPDRRNPPETFSALRYGYQTERTFRGWAIASVMGRRPFGEDRYTFVGRLELQGNAGYRTVFREEYANAETARRNVEKVAERHGVEWKSSWVTTDADPIPFTAWEDNVEFELVTSAPPGENPRPSGAHIGPRGGQLIGTPSRIEYRHADDGNEYYHDFEGGDIYLEALPDGALIIWSPDRSLWRDY